MLVIFLKLLKYNSKFRQHNHDKYFNKIEPYYNLFIQSNKPNMTRREFINGFRKFSKLLGFSKIEIEIFTIIGEYYFYKSNNSYKLNSINNIKIEVKYSYRGSKNCILEYFKFDNIQLNFCYSFKSLYDLKNYINLIVKDSDTLYVLGDNYEEIKTCVLV